MRNWIGYPDDILDNANLSRLYENVCQFKHIDTVNLEIFWRVLFLGIFASADLGKSYPILDF